VDGRDDRHACLGRCHPIMSSDGKADDGRIPLLQPDGFLLFCCVYPQLDDVRDTFSTHGYPGMYNTVPVGNKAGICKYPRLVRQTRRAGLRLARLKVGAGVAGNMQKAEGVSEVLC
jgi:hypothetical protein